MIERSKEWWMKFIEDDDGSECGVGSLVLDKQESDNLMKIINAKPRDIFALRTILHSSNGCCNPSCKVCEGAPCHGPLCEKCTPDCNKLAKLGDFNV